MKTKVLLLLMISYVLFFHNLGVTALWDPDEPRQAIMAREMMDRGDYIHPYLNGKPYLEKPPLYPWMIILASKAQGALDEFSARAPAALSATLLVLITYSLGVMLQNPWGGLIGALVLATNYQFLSNARESVMDMTFAFFIGLTIYLTYLALKRREKWLFALAFIPSALAILTKGPAGLVIPAGVIFIYMIVEKEMKRFIVPLIAGCVLSLAVSAVWFLLAGEEYIKEFIFRQNVTRYMNAFDHMESIFYYFHKLIANFLPWSVFLPFALYHGFKKKYWLPFVWFVFTFLFFEISTSKRAIYLLSCYPACALLCGLYIRDKWSDLVNGRLTGLALKLFALAFLLLPVAGAVALSVMSDPTVMIFKSSPLAIYSYIGVLTLAGATFFVMLLRKSSRAALVSFFLYLAITGIFYNSYYMPLMDREYKSPRRITDPLQKIKKNADIYTFGFSSAGFIYYIGKPIETNLVLSRIKDDKSDILLIIEDDMAAHLQKELNSRFAPVGTGRYEREYYTFYVRKDGT